RPADGRLPQDAQGVAARPDRARGRALRECGRASPSPSATARSRGCARPCATSAPPAPLRPSPRLACAAAAARASRPARSGGAPPGRPPASPTAWRAAATHRAAQRAVVATGYGADPSVRTDATLLAADPWTVIEGITIAAFAIRATEAIIAVRAEDTALVTL